MRQQTLMLYGLAYIVGVAMLSPQNLRKLNSERFKGIGGDCGVSGWGGKLALSPTLPLSPRTRVYAPHTLTASLPRTLPPPLNASLPKCPLCPPTLPPCLLDYAPLWCIGLLPDWVRLPLRVSAHLPFEPL